MPNASKTLPPDAPLLIDSLPYTQLSDRLPSAVRNMLDGVPILRPVLPDPGVLVYVRPATLAARISGFADKETVAQAARNAATHS